MINKIQLFLLFFFTCFLSAVAQDFNDYKTLQNKGALPDDFITPSSWQYKKAIEEAKKESESSAESNRDFYLKTTFSIGELMRSGQVLYHEEYTTYFQSIVKLLLANNPVLAKKIRVYILRSNTVNAFATANDCILLSMGLLAQIKNEAQLAFVLAHEITHIEKKHSLDLYVKSIEIKRKDEETNKNVDAFKDNEIDIKQFRKHAHSRENEFEADAEGFKKITQTNYTLGNAEELLNVLKFARVPFNNTKFEKDFLECENLTIPTSLLLSEIAEVAGNDENADDTRNTHPNLAKRKDAIRKMIADGEAKERKDYLVSQETFEKLRKIARFEAPSIALHGQDYVETIYNVFLLSKIQKESIYLDKMKLKALYGLTKYTNINKGSVIDTLFSEGEILQVHHILKNMSPSEINVLALLHTQSMLKKYPKDKEVNDIFKDLVWELTNHIENESDFTQMDYSWVAKPLGTLKTNTQFATLFKKMAQERSKRKNVTLTKKQKKQIEIAYKRGKRLGIEKLIYVSSVFLELNVYDETNPINYFKSEAMQKYINERIKAFSKKIGIETIPLAKGEIKQENTDKMNEATLLNEWFREQNNAGEVPILGYKQQEVENIADKYKADNCLWVGIVSSKQAKQALFMVMLYNVKTGSNEIIKKDWFLIQGQKWLVDLQLFDALKQIKSKPRKK